MKLALALALLLMLGWGWRSSIDVQQLPAHSAPLQPADTGHSQASASQTSISAAAPAPVQSPASAVKEADSVAPTPADNWLPNAEAVASLAHARVNGDARAPALSETVQRSAPTMDELADHDLYLAYEQRQDKQLKRAYVEAAQVKTAELQSWIAKGRQYGISDAQIAQAQRKLQGIQAMAAELQQQHPDLLNEEFRPQQTPWLQMQSADASNSVQTQTQP
ncbi:hypothetical protein CHH28_07215 [Bacterioplanes sanyensis]|uniref:Uncharacterized protein n=1 Tax=Bacterioplanes sanyensis TaxID=1249553 RepID=A0A222FJ02_9GAMM|nr:hypothetical protein [Bacterioplanes sanyensis]ASP38474.1 hypothetical protein CHH28_07215 [Bacterioplanes sanyensis]